MMASLLVVLGALAALGGAVWPAQRRALARMAAVLLGGACGWLVLLLLTDAFGYRYVWLYSAVELPWYLKLANLWGGEEGTLLLLAALLALAALRLCAYRGWAAPGGLLLTALFALGALIWNPFTPTSAAELAQAQSLGMNAHLTRVWMALHPPLVFISYTIILVPIGAAVEMLARGTGDWPLLARRYNRIAWLILSAGLAAGMWWAFEDFTFGQVWHWDPVQTSVFIVWALLSAQLHGLRGYSPAGFLGRTLPVLALLTAVAALVAMLVTRNGLLASSHRYIGDTSAPLLLALIGLLLLAGVWAGVLAWQRRLPRRPRLNESRWLLFIAVILFTLLAALAGGYLTHAYIAEWLAWPRPAALKPFFDTLARWTDTAELPLLRRAFAQWDVDNFALNRLSVPLLIVMGFIGGHAFLPLRNRRLAWLLTISTVGAALAVAYWLTPLDRFYSGTGMTSRHTVELFFGLDLLLLAAAYLALSALVWLLRRWWRQGWRATLNYALPISLIHVGVMLALCGAVSALVLDAYVQRTLNYPQDFSGWQRFPDGYALALSLNETGPVADGARGTAGAGGYRAVADVQLRLERAGVAQVWQGQTVYRDARAPDGVRGSVRQLCEILDYRYARYAGGPSYRLDPFIDRGFWYDVQVWVPAPATPDDQITVVIKTYPLLSWLWLGLVLALSGALLLTLTQRSGKRPSTVPSRRTATLSPDDG